jgi:hypothetical protein
MKRFRSGANRKGDNKKVSFDRVITFELFMVLLRMRGMQETKKFDLGPIKKCCTYLPADC